MLVNNRLDEADWTLAVLRSLLVDESNDGTPDWCRQAGTIGQSQIALDVGSEVGTVSANIWEATADTVVDTAILANIALSGEDVEAVVCVGWIRWNVVVQVVQDSLILI